MPQVSGKPLDAMATFIRISPDWSDEDVLQLRIEVSDGASTFVSSAYVSPDWFGETADALERFGKQVYGGLYDMEAGTPGPEFAGGSFLARFHWYKPTGLFISARHESDFFDFKGHQVANEAKLFLRTEPALLDRFIAELRAVGPSRGSVVTLTCIPLDGV
ncbi:MAG: hypothetical protein ACRD8O_02070 [Bryobacteraceae bacterium]